MASSVSMFHGARQPAPQAPHTRILVVDDVEEEGKLSKCALETVRGYEVQVETSPLQALKTARQWCPDVILLDVSMEELDGLTLGRTLKAEGCKADLMYVSGLKEMDTIEEGLEVADHYLKKPFEPRELLALMRVILRKRNPRTDQIVTDANDLRPVIDYATRIVYLHNGRAPELTPTELRLLLALLDGNGEVVPNKKLLEDVWESQVSEEEGCSQLVQTNISRLRKKIEINPRQPELIITVQKVGYIYRLRP